MVIFRSKVTRFDHFSEFYIKNGGLVLFTELNSFNITVRTSSREGMSVGSEHSRT